MRPIVFGNDEQSRGILIDAVHDAGTKLPVDAAQMVEAKQKRIDERSLVIAASGVYRHALWLVDDRDVLVLIDDIERDVLGAGSDGPGIGDLNLDLLPVLQNGARLHGPARNEHMALIDELFDGAPREARPFAQKHVDAEATLRDILLPIHRVWTRLAAPDRSFRRETSSLRKPIRPRPSELPERL